MDLVPIDLVLYSNESNGESIINPNNPRFILDELRDVVGVCVLQASIPFSYYVFDNLNNQLKIVVTGGTTPLPSTYTCTISPGSYNSINLVAQLQKAFQTSVNSSGQTVNLTTAGFVAWVDVTSSALVIYTSGSSTSFQVDFTNVNSAQQILGYTNGGITASQATAGAPLYDNNDTARTSGYYAISPFSVNLSGENLLLLHSSLASSVFGTVRTHTNASDIIQIITVNNNYQGMIEWNNPFPEKKPMTKTTITSASFYLTLGTRTRFKAGDSETQYLDLRGQPFQLWLRFYQISDARVDYYSNRLGDRSIMARSQTGSSKQPHNKKMRYDSIISK